LTCHKKISDRRLKHTHTSWNTIDREIWKICSNSIFAQKGRGLKKKSRAIEVNDNLITFSWRFFRTLLTMAECVSIFRLNKHIFFQNKHPNQMRKFCLTGFVFLNIFFLHYHEMFIVWSIVLFFDKKNAKKWKNVSLLWKCMANFVMREKQRCLVQVHYLLIQSLVRSCHHIIVSFHLNLDKDRADNLKKGVFPEGNIQTLKTFPIEIFFLSVSISIW